MYLFAVYATDRVEKTTVCIGDMLTRTEAGEIKRTLEKYSACDITIVSTKFYRNRREMEDAFL